MGSEVGFNTLLASPDAFIYAHPSGATHHIYVTKGLLIASPHFDMASRE